MRKNAGFTLIELLVVVAIIAVLVAILLPALSSARESARTAVCLSNVGQLGKAISLFSMENNDSFPIYNQLPGHWKNIWAGQVSKYYGTNYQLLRCPSFPLELGYWLDPWGQGEPTSYGLNFWYINGCGDGTGTIKKVSRVAQPSEMVLICDAAYTDEGLSTWGNYVVVPPSLSFSQNQWAPWERPAFRHSGENCGVVFLDNHAQAIKGGTQFYPKLPWLGNGISDPKHPDYKDQVWDMD